MIDSRTRAHPPSLIARFLSLLLPVLLIIANLFFFVPSAIVQGNPSEFDAGLYAILRLYIVPAGLMMTLLIGSGLLWPPKRFPCFVSVLSTFGILLWIQGSILVWRYGLLDGQAFDWTVGRWRGYVDILIWLGLLTIAWIFHRRLFRFAARAAALVLLIQLIAFSLHIPRTPFAPQRAVRLPPAALTQFSTTRNVIHVVLDGFQSTLFQKLLDQNRGYYDKSLTGFTFFREALGSFPTTYMSIPAAFSGRVYHNEMPIKEWLRDTLRGRTIQNALFRSGYDVDLIHAVPIYIEGLYTNACFIPQPYSRNSPYRDNAQAALLFDLTLFREAPHFAKRFVYNDQTWLFQRMYTKMDMYPAIGHRKFFADFIGAMAARRTRPVYKFIHLVTTHAPVIFDKNGRFTGKPLPWNEKNQLNQARVGLAQFIEFLDRLRSLGLYDSSLIVLQADTGSGHPVSLRNADHPPVSRKFRCMVGGALPLLVIKQPFGQGPLTVSDAPVMLTDIPATLDALLNLGAQFPGRSVFATGLSADRLRSYSDYAWVHKNWLQDYLPPMETYEIRGSAFDAHAWRHTGTIASGNRDELPTPP
jgi:hypothetical protein